MECRRPTEYSRIKDQVKDVIKNEISTMCPPVKCQNPPKLFLLLVDVRVPPTAAPTNKQTEFNQIQMSIISDSPAPDIN